MVRYFTNVGPAKGPILYRDWSLLGAIGVLQGATTTLPSGCAGHGVG